MKWPLKFTVTTEGEGRWDVDRFGNETWIPGETETRKVFAYHVTRSEESLTEGQWRLVEVLRIIAPPGSFTPEGTVTLPDGTRWHIDGNAEDYENNPYYSPGLVIYHARKVS